MIISNPYPFIGQLKIIELKSYENYWCEDKWKSVLSSKDYLFRIYNIYDLAYGFSCFHKVGSMILLDKLCVRESYRGQGVGSELMSDFIISFQSLKKKCILREDNKYLSWAAAWGWKAIELKKGMFGEIDGILMENNK